MKIKDVINYEKPNSVRVVRNGNGIPMELVVWAASGRNEMALPRELGSYFQTVRGWEFERMER